MTRKDYVATAKILSEFAGQIDEFIFEDLVDEFGDMFAADNERFNLEKFREACTQ